MVDDARSQADIAFARRLGVEYGGRLNEAARRSSASLWESDSAEPAALFSDLVREVVRDVAPQRSRVRFDNSLMGPRGLTAQAGTELEQQMNGGLQLIRRNRMIGFDGVMVWTAEREDAFGMPVLFDLFNPIAIQLLTREDRDPLPDVGDFNVLRKWAERSVNQFGAPVAIVPSEVACVAFTTLYSDSLCTVMQATMGGSFVNSGSGVNSSYVDFTVKCGNGYQLDFYEQFNFSPRAFAGGAMTSPVSQSILIGNYRFLGTRNGQRRLDSGLYLASPSTPSATLRSF